MGSVEAVIAIIAGLVKLGNFVAAMMQDNKQQGIGRMQALAEALEAAHKDLALADAARVEADEAHAKDSTDNAFDLDFRRSD